MYDEAKVARRSATEGFLTLLAGLRKVPVMSEKDVAYNNALGDAFDYYIEHEPEHLYPFTVQNGKWNRDYIGIFELNNK